MWLTEMPVGAKIIFNVSIQKQELEFPSEVVEVHDNFNAIGSCSRKEYKG